MASTNPSQAYPEFSQSPGQSVPSRPAARSHPSDDIPPEPPEHREEDHHPQTSAATLDGTADDTNLATGNPTRSDGVEAPSFQPFFTLIEDTHTAEYHHPTVHYIFSDDDTDIVTEAALHSLEAQQDAQAAKGEQLRRQEDNDEDGKSALLPPAVPGVRENYIVLDVEPVTATWPASDPSKAIPESSSGKHVLSTSPTPAPESAHPSSKAAPVSQQFRVTSAKSFSPTWQVLSSEMVPAPTFDNGNSGDTPGHGLMLKIHGTGGIPYDSGKEKPDGGARKLEEMMDQFAKRMRELQMVIDAAHVAGEGGDDQPDPTGGAAVGEARDEAVGGKAVHEERS